jgi:peroxiredoxin
MSLENELAALKADISSRVDPETAKILDEARYSLTKSGIASRALKTGDQAPDFALPDALGKILRLSELLKDGPVVLIFYRGQWCPFCNLTLRSYQAVQSAINRYEGQLVAISAQKPDQSLSMQEKNALTFPVLSDSENAASRAFGLLFQLPEPLVTVFKARQIDLPSINEAGTWELPIPAIYVIAKDGKIVTDHVDPDHRNRLEPEQVISALKTLA